MAYVPPLFDDEVVDLAGDALIGDPLAIERLHEARIEVDRVVNNWRASHAYPLNTFAVTLRTRTRRFDPNGLVAQRIKRMSSIEDKLGRMDVTLSQMQDIAGCRVIVESVAQVNDLVELYKTGYSSHRLDSENDYIRHPKSDGYRGRHLIYRYIDPAHGEYEGFKIEMQFRSQLQHSWATAVEVADIYLREGLKAHRGSPDWQRFFALMGTAMALREGCRRVPRTPSDRVQLVSELRELVERLNVKTRLSAFGQTLQTITGTHVPRWLKYVVLVLDPKEATTRLYAYTADEIEEATRTYVDLERYKVDGSDAVLVSVSDATSLRRAYPNYFLDTTAFLEALEEAIV